MPEHCKDLLAGFEDFVARDYGSDNAVMPRLVAEGQQPDYVIISCIDSRSNPGMVFQTRPGTFFGHKAMGAIVRPYQKGTALSATLQFALNYNGIRKIVVLGHTGCGAIKALIDEIDDPEIGGFIAVARDSLEQARAQGATDHDLQRRTEEQIVLQSVENLKTYPCVQKMQAQGSLHIMPWLFCMEEGALYEYCSESKKFEKIS